MQLEDGYLVVLSRDQAKVFFGQREDQPRLAFLQELLASSDTCRLCLDGRWQALHDALSALAIEDSLLSQCILGGRPLHQGNDYHVCLVRPDVVRFIADQAHQIDESSVEASQLDLCQAVLGIYKEAAELAGAMVFVAKKI